MDKSLDEIMTERRKLKSGAVRASKQHREQRVAAASTPYSKVASAPRGRDREAGGSNGSGSIFSRLGGRQTGGSASSGGTKVSVSNLKFDVMEDDLRELFSTVGELKSVQVIYDRRSGRSLGKAEVVFARRSDAINAVKNFHGRTVDDEPMEVKLAGEGGRENPFNPSFDDGDDSGRGSAAHSNVREGLFGTALRKGGARDDSDRHEGSGRGGRGGGRPQKQHQQPSRDVTFSVTLDGGRKSDRRENEGRQARGNQGGRGGGRGAGRGSGRGGRGRGGFERDARTEEELDAEMDEYMSHKK